MKVSQISVLGIRLVALYCFFMAFVSLTAVFLGGNLKQSAIMFLSGFGPSAAAGILIWVLAVPLSKKMLPSSEEESCLISFGLPEAYRLALVVMGVFIMTKAIPDIISALYTMVYITPNNPSYRGIANGSWLIAGVKIVVGFLLTFNNQKLLNLILKKNNVG